MALRLTEEEYAELLARQQQFQGEKYVGGRPEATKQRGHDDEAPLEFKEKPYSYRPGPKLSTPIQVTLLQKNVDITEKIYRLLNKILCTPVFLGIFGYMFYKREYHIRVFNYFRELILPYSHFIPLLVVFILIGIIWINREGIDRLWTRIGRQ